MIDVFSLLAVDLPSNSSASSHFLDPLPKAKLNSILAPHLVRRSSGCSQPQQRRKGMVMPSSWLV